MSNHPEQDYIAHRDQSHNLSTLLIDAIADEIRSTFDKPHTPRYLPAAVPIEFHHRHEAATKFISGTSQMEAGQGEVSHKQTIKTDSLNASQSNIKEKPVEMHLTAEVKNGDSYWSIARAHIGPNSKNSDIAHESERISKLNHGKNLKPGDNIRIA